MLKNMDFLQDRFEELTEKIADPNVIANITEWQKLIKEHANLEPIVKKYGEFKQAEEALEENLEMVKIESDEEMVEMLKEEINSLKKSLPELEHEIKLLLIPQDPNDDKNVILEIRAGAGGDEAGIFAGDLFRMYSRFAERNRWKIEIMSMSDTGVGGVKEVIALIKGSGAYSRLKYESGVHRVQRVPATESSGRIHTSTATVAVLPEVDDVEVDVNPNDLKIDVFRASGNGGQCVNTTDSAVRMTHIPTGIVVSMQDEKSQLKNRDKALKILKARLYEKYQSEQQAEIAAERKSQVGSGDRSAKIRTYNFPQGRITDHRINMTVYKLDAFLDGEINEMIDALTTQEQTDKLNHLDDEL
ncbi:MAG: peptide chain release factor 1 [Tissierellales bacterium]|nr:peptide chain release factor 1 [Tissierellales bacterium]